MRMFRKIFLLIAISPTLSQPSWGADQSTTEALVNPNVWGLQTSIQNYRLHGEDEHDLIGSSGRVGFGYGSFLGEHILIQGQLDIYAGPWSRTRGGAFDMDFTGTGVTFESIFNLGFSAGGLRSGGSSWAGVLSASYVDLAGRSIGPNHHETNNPAESSNFFLEHNYRLNMTALWLTPALSWQVLQRPRPIGNTPELLSTRVEGYSLRLGIGVPVYSVYRAQSLRRDRTPNANQNLQEFSEKGRFSGYSVVASIHTWLGT